MASDIATCTMAKVRSLGLLPTSLATSALAIMFQSVMTSARTGATRSTAATMPGSQVGAGSSKTDLIGRLPRFAVHAMGCFVRDGSGLWISAGSLGRARMYEFLHSVYPELYNLSAAFMFDFLASSIRATRCVNQGVLMRPSWVSALTPSSRPISWVILPL